MEIPGSRCHLAGGDLHGGLVADILLEVSADVLQIHRGIPAELLQILQHLVGGAVALVCIGVHSLHADQLQSLGNVLVDVPGSQRHGAQVLDGHGHGAVALKGQPPGEHLIEHHTGGVNIRPRIGPLTSGLLGRDVVDAAQGLLGQGLAGAGKAGDAEIGHLHAAVPEHHNVLGLDVPVNDAPAVGVAEAAHDLGDKVEGLAPVHLAAALHVLLEGNALNELHDDVLRIITAGHIVHGYDIGMGELGDGLALIPEAAAEIRAVRKIALQNFHSHQTIQTMTLRLIDVGHTAAADQFQDLISVVQHFSNVLIHLCHSFP